MAALLEETRRRRERVVTSSGCVGQSWRRGGPRQALLARLLRGTDEHPLDPRVSRAVGRLCATSRTGDVVDAHVALLAVDGDIVLTSDAADLRRLFRSRGTKVNVIAV
ncbi:MAG: hypothetical protein ACYDH6_12945 [Acidimicrobiales bacterium]